MKHSQQPSIYKLAIESSIKRLKEIIKNTSDNTEKKLHGHALHILEVTLEAANEALPQEQSRYEIAKELFEEWENIFFHTSSFCEWLEEKKNNS